jgi:hypothetical protein
MPVSKQAPQTSALSLSRFVARHCLVVLCASILSSVSVLTLTKSTTLAVHLDCEADRDDLAVRHSLFCMTRGQR